MKIRFALAAAAMLGTGPLFALQHSFTSQKVTLDQLPQAAQQAIKAHAGNAPIQDIDMETFDGMTTYQAAFNKNGKHQEYRVDQQGHMRSSEWRVIPAAVDRAAEQRIGTSQITGYGKYAVNGQAVYHFRYNQNGAPAEVWVNENGKIIQKPEGVTVTDTASSAIGGTLGAAGANATTSGQTVVNQSSATSTTTSGTSVVEFKDLPWPVQQTIMNQAGGANVQRVRVTQNNGQTIYHAHFNKNGQPTRIAVNSDGSLLNTTAGAPGIDVNAGQTTTQLSGGTKVTFNDLPQAVKNAITSQANGAAIEDIDKGTINGQTAYEAAFKKDGRTYELQVKEDGSIIGGHFD